MEITTEEAMAAVTTQGAMAVTTQGAMGVTTKEMITTDTEEDTFLDYKQMKDCCRYQLWIISKTFSLFVNYIIKCWSCNIYFLLISIFQYKSAQGHTLIRLQIIRNIHTYTWKEIKKKDVVWC